MMSDGKLIKKIDSYGAPQSGGVLTIAISPTKNYLAYSVYDELKMFTYSISGSAMAETLTDALKANSLSFHATVTPNPLITSATIQYKLSSKQKVSLSVYDVAGRKIAELVNGEKEAGTYNVIFDAAHLKNGIYIYRLITTSGNFLLKCFLTWSACLVASLSF